MTARGFFCDPAGNVRPPWKLAVFATSNVVSLVIITGAVVPLVSGTAAAFGVRIVVYPWALLASALLAHALTFHWVERRDGWAMVGLSAAALRPAPILRAALLGAAAVTVPSLLLLGVGWLRVEHAAPGSSALAALSIGAFLAPAALWEELIFRGYAFAVLALWWGTPTALVVTSIAFGLVHLANAGASINSILVVVLAGVFLGGVLVATRSLYAAFAAHLAWNWSLAGALHTVVSGIPFSVPDYRVVDAGPDWATGGVWGPEGGLAAALGLVAVTLYLYVRRRRREES